jgi:imidazolonepropionase-like amidohydrolase
MAFEIRAAHGWDGSEPLHGPIIVRVADSRIERLSRDAGPPSAPSIYDCGEATILPGLVDMHTHLGIDHRTGEIRAQMADPAVRHILSGACSLQDDRLSGVTTAKLNGDRDSFDLQMRDAIRDGKAEGPRLVVSGRGIKSSRCTGGVVATCIADGPAAVAQGVDENLAAGSDWIKLFASGNVFGDRAAVLQPFYGLPELRVAVEKAHAAGRRVSVHCFGGEAADACLAAGVDVIDHGWLLSDRQLDALAERRTWLCPTVGVLTHPEGVLAHVPAGDARDTAKRRVDEVCMVVARAQRAGVRLLAGTDAMHGGLAAELATLQALGGKATDLLRAATGNAGEALGLDEVGVLREGGPADLVVVKGNALDEIRCLHDVLMVVQAGEIVRGPTSEVRGPGGEVNWPDSAVSAVRKVRLVRRYPQRHGDA